jgi:NAD(P)-dependent dehydrogenase (short-subunit alcohol dehydrogenase family)
VAVPRADVMHVFETNAAGALTVTQEFLPLVNATKERKV